MTGGSSSPKLAELPDNGPGLGLRCISLPREEFDSVTGGLWRISARPGGPPSQHFVPGISQNSVAPVPVVAVTLESPTMLRHPRRPDPPRSIFGLPIISCRDPMYMYWVLVVMVLDLTYSAFLLPLSVGFEVNDLEWTWACFADLAAGLFFAVELFLGFHTSYMASNGGHRREVSGGRSVARYYVQNGSFWQDALSVGIWVTQIVLLLVHQAGGMPMTSSSNAFQYVRIIRMVRFIFVMRQLCVLTMGGGSGSLIPGMRVPPRAAQALNIAYSSAVLLHFFACLWNFIALREGLDATWLNTIAALVRRYSADGASPLTAEELAGVPAGERYVLGFYFSAVTIATLGYGDIVPVRMAEWLVDTAIIAVGVLLFGLAMGSLGEMVASSSKVARQAQLYREKMEGVDSWLHSASVPRHLKLKIRNFYSDVWLKHAAKGVHVGEQFRELPHALRQETAWELNRKLLQRLPLFCDLSDSQRYALSGMLVPLDLTPGQELCLHGEPADRIWLLHEGEVQVFDEVSVVRVAAAPAVLGVEALLQHVDTSCAVRPYGYRTSTPCALWQAHLEDLLPYLLANLEALDSLSTRAQEQREAEAEAVKAQHEAAAAVVGAQQQAAAAAASVEVVKKQVAAMLAVDIEAVCNTPAAPALGGGHPSGVNGADAAQQGPAAAEIERADSLGPAGSLMLLGPAGSEGPQQRQAALHATMLAAGQHTDGGGGSDQQAWAPRHWDTSAGALGPSAQHLRTGAGLETVYGEPSAPAMPAATSADSTSPATKGELFHLRAEVVGRLDMLATEMRRAFAAASLAQSVSMGAQRYGRRRMGRTDSQTALANNQPRRSHWNYGQLHHGSP